MALSGVPRVDVLEYCKSFASNSTQLIHFQVQDSWHPRTITFEDVLKLSRAKLQMAYST